ncbi:hypothetical protein JNUCC64_03850 [Streptomyces sp. JNUCC 64]
MNDHQSVPTADRKAESELTRMLASTHNRLGRAVEQRVTAQGGVPELQDPELALSRILAAAHRSALTAVKQRLDRRSAPARSLTAPVKQPPSKQPGKLTSPAETRLKHRQDTLLLVRAYWPCDLLDMLRSAREMLERLEDGPARASGCRERAIVEKVGARLAEVRKLPTTRQRPASAEGTDFLTEAEVRLARPAEELRHEVEQAWHLLTEELTPLIRATDPRPHDVALAGSVAQDVADDLAYAARHARELSEAAAELERLNDDFTGADLTRAPLGNAWLKGVLWDAATIWPDDWEPRIRRASLPHDAHQGTLVIASDPRLSLIPAEA